MSSGSVSACSLAPGARGGDVEEGLGLSQLRPSLHVAHVDCGGLCLLVVERSPDFGDRRDPSELRTEQRGLGQRVVEKMGV